MLTELALHFILLHEVAHFACGHLGLEAARRKRKGAFSLSEIGHEFALDQTGERSAIFEEAEHKCIELQADFLAEELHFLFHRVQSVDSPEQSVLARSAKVLPELVQVRGNVLSTVSPAEKHRAVASAAGATFLLMDAWRKDFSQERAPVAKPRRETHPLPETRAMQMLTSTFALPNFDKSTERDGVHVISTTDENVVAEIVATIRERMNPLIVDMVSMAETLDVPSSYLRLDLDVAPASDPDLAHPSASIQDLLLLLFEGAKSASDF